MHFLVWPFTLLVAVGLLRADAGWCEDQHRQPRPGLSGRGTIPAPQMARRTSGEPTGEPGVPSAGDSRQVWKSQDLDVLAVGLGIGDLDGDGKSEIVVCDPSSVYAYRFDGVGLRLLAQYSPGSGLELKSVDVAGMRKQGPCRIYVTAQNRGMLSSFVLEYRNGTLVPVIKDLPYYLRVLIYPTQGPILLGQRKGIKRFYEGPVMRLVDKGDALETQERFGIPLKIPIFGFAVGDLLGDRHPLIAVYDRTDHLRVYEPGGKRLYVSREHYGGSDILLRRTGLDSRQERNPIDGEGEDEFFRPRIMAMDLRRAGRHEVLVITHSSKTGRYLGRTKMLEDGRVSGLEWNGDAFDRRWRTPRIQGMLTDFAVVDSLPGLSGRRLVTLERKKTDWLSFLQSKSQLRAYDVDWLLTQGGQGSAPVEGGED